jgi:hypothetical protein
MNVYYLPTCTPTPEAVPASEWPSLPERLRNAWWRLRLAVVEIRGLLRSRPRYTGSPSQDDLFADAAPPSRPVGPARVIDFQQARQRLRPGRLEG